MLHALGTVGRTGEFAADGVVAGSGSGWAAAAIPPPACEPTCGAGIYSDGRDLLAWAGEMFLPDAWKLSARQETPQRAIGTAVLDRIRHQGAAVLADVDGAFCGAWYDGDRRRWTVFNDRLGLIPVFYGLSEERLVVGPQARLTWQATGEPLTINELGVADLLRCENMAEDHTLIGGIRWLRGGHLLEWSSEGGQRTRRYWDFQHRGDPECNKDGVIDGYVNALERTIRRHADSCGPLRLGISGGLDSRMYLGFCKRVGRMPACFTAGWAFGDDLRYGRRVARAAGAPHEWVEMEEASLPDRLVDAIVETDGLHSAAHLAPATAMKAYLQEYPGSVLLEGYLHGVLGGAYVPSDEDIARDVPPHRSAWARRRLHAGGEFDLIDGLLSPELAAESHTQWQSRVDDAYRGAPTDDPLAKAEHAIASSRSGRIDVLGTGLLRGDVLVRNPACDRIMLDWHARTPIRMRRGKRVFLEVIRRHFPRLARVQRTSSSGLPIAEDRWLREYCWQREKLHRWWVGRRHPWTRCWGTGGRAIRAWTFETWRRSGRLDDLVADDARVLNWVRRTPLQRLWDHARSDPLRAGPLLSLATIEFMVRRLERLPAGLVVPTDDPVRFRAFDPSSARTTDKTGVPALSA